MSSWAAIRGLFSNGISVDKVSDTRAVEQVSGIVNATDESVMRGDLDLVQNDLLGAESHYQQAGQITNQLSFVRGIAETMFALSNVEQRLDHRTAALIS